MANPERGEVAVKAGEQTYTLVCDLNAMCELEALLSTPDRPAYFPEIVQRLMRGSMRDIRAFLWAALRRHHGEMTLQDVAAFVRDAGGIAAINQQLEALLTAAQPDPEDVPKKEAAARPRPAQIRPGGTGVINTSKPAASA